MAFVGFLSLSLLTQVLRWLHKYYIGKICSECWYIAQCMRLWTEAWLSRFHSLAWCIWGFERYEHICIRHIHSKTVSHSTRVVHNIYHKRTNDTHFIGNWELKVRIAGRFKAKVCGGVQIWWWIWPVLGVFCHFCICILPLPEPLRSYLSKVRG